MYGVGISFSYLKLLHILDIGKKSVGLVFIKFSSKTASITTFPRSEVLSYIGR